MDVISHPRLADLMEEKEEDHPKEIVELGPVEGELQLFDEKS